MSCTPWKTSNVLLSGRSCFSHDKRLRYFALIRSYSGPYCQRRITVPPARQRRPGNSCFPPFVVCFVFLQTSTAAPRIVFPDTEDTVPASISFHVVGQMWQPVCQSTETNNPCTSALCALGTVSITADAERWRHHEPRSRPANFSKKALGWV